MLTALEKSLGTLALSAVLCAAFATQAVADDGRAVEIEVRPDGPTRQVKPVNGVGQPPMIGAPRSFPMMHYLKDAGIPFSRLHDVGGAYGRMTYVDIPNLFRDFDADETKPENYDFAFTDRLISALVDSGVEPIFRLGVTIENYADIKAYRIAPPKDFAKWARICEHVIRHYNEGWADGFRHGIRYWEIWNEPDNMPEPEKNTMWSGSFDEFMRLYGTAARHLKKKFPHLKIGGYGSCGFYAPVGAGTVRAANSSPRAEHFVDCCTNFLARARDEGWPLDFFSFHSYSRPEHAVRQVEVARRVLDEYGFTATETCFDEWLPEPQKFRCGTALAASKIAAEIIGLQNSSCDMAMIYDARCGVGDYSPLFNPMTQKPHKAYYAFVAFNELRKAGLAVPCMVSDDRIWACAAKGGDGKVRVMLSNPCDEAVEIKIKGLSGVLSCMLTDESRTYERVPFSPRLPPRSFVLMETPAADIQARIDVAAERGGGRVVVQKGVHRCGTIRLKSGVELHLEEGAVLMGGSKPDDYDDVIPEEMVYRYGNANTSPTVTRKAFIIAEDAENIAITGKGTVHIDGPRFFDQGSSLWGYWWAKPPCPRPRAVVMYRCRNVRIEGVTFKDCPLWTMWLRLCDDISIGGITIDAEQKMINSDGIDFDGCRHVRVGNSRLKTGDDCLVLRSIRYGHPGEKSVVTEDVVVSNCVLNSFCQGVRIGCPSDDTIRNATFRDIEFTGLNGIVSKQPRVYLNEGCNGYLKTDGILFENWKIDCYGHPVEILVEPGIALRDFGHMTFRNIEVNARKPFVVRGNEPTPLRGIRFENVSGIVSSDNAFDVAFAPGAVFDRVDVSKEEVRTVGPGGGGWIESVLPSRHDPKRFFAGCDVGGFYFSSNGGRRWEIRNCGLGNPMVETIAEDPSNPSRLIVGGDGGLYVSDNLGVEWRHLTNGLPPPRNNGHSLPVKRVAWDEVNPRRVYAATGCPRGKGREAGTLGHLYRSDDGGETWSMVVAPGDPLLAERPTEIYDLALSAKDGADLLALTSRGLFRSRNAGVNWRKAGSGLPKDTLAKALSRSVANPARVYLATRDKKPKPFPHEASVWRSDDGGETWSKTAALPDFHRLSDGREPMDAWGRSCVAADPSDPDTVWCGGIWFKQGLCVSHDGGRSWSVSVGRLPYGWLDEFWHSPAVSLAVARANPRTVAFGTSSGIYRTEDGGATWTQCYTAERRSGEAIAGTGLDVLCVSEIVPDRFARGRWFAAFYDVGLMVTEDEGRSWTRCMGGIPKSHAGICSTVAQSPTEPNLCWAVFGTWGGGGRGLPARSVDGGRTWTLARNPKGWTEGLARNMQVLSSAAPYALAVAHAKMGLVTSGDGGERWAAMSTNALPCARRVVSLAAADGALYAGTASKGGVPPQVWRSADKGRTWNRIFAPSASEADGSVEGMAVSGRRIAVVVKCIGKRGGCWLSEDSGATWRRVYHEKPWNDLNAVAFCGGRLFLSSRNARWHDDGFGGRGLVSVGLGAISQDGWRRHAAGGFDRPEIMCLVADPFDDRRLLVGTWGNSISVFLL